MRSIQLYVRALTAAFCLALIIFATPILLWAIIGNPLPDRSALEVGDFSDDVVLHIMATLAWLGWASIVLAFAIEARAQIAERPAPSLPVLSGQQNFARSLLAAVLLTAPTVAVAATISHPSPLAEPAHPVRPPSTGQSELDDGHRHPERQDNERRPVIPLGNTARVSHQTFSHDTGTRSGPAAPSPANRSSSAQPFLLGSASGIGISLAAAGLHAAVQSRRRQQQAVRRPGELVPPAAPEVARIEKDLVVRVLFAHGLRERLRTALRHLDASLAKENRPRASILAARIDAERTELILAQTDTAGSPEPWDLDQATGNWILDGVASLDDFAADPAAILDVSTRRWVWIGSSQPSDQRPTPEPLQADAWLLNLAVAGSVRVYGDRDQTVDLARAMLLSLPHSPADKPAGTADSPVAVHSAAADLKELADLVRANTTGPSSTNRLPWLHLIDERQQAAALRSAQTRAALAGPGSVSVSLSDDLGSGRGENVRLVVGPDAQLRASFTSARLNPAAIGHQDLLWLEPLLAVAQPLATRPAPWAAEQHDVHLVTEANDLAEPQDGGEARQLETKENSSTSAPVKPAGHRRSTLSARGETGSGARRRSDADDPKMIPHPIAARAPAADDPSLDRDLQLWHADFCARPRLRLLGPVEVRANGQAPPAGRIGWWTEIVTLLYAHPNGLTSDQFAELLWPRDAHRKVGTAMPRQAISTVRNWLGTDPDSGQLYLPRIATNEVDGRYRIEHFLTDEHLARRLYARWNMRRTGDISDLQTALDLVAGSILDQRRPTGYLWLLDLPLVTDLTALVTDTAHTLAEHWLKRGEADQAAAASRVALAAGGFDDTTHFDLIRAAEMQGRRQEADHWLRQLLQVHGVEKEEDLPAWTAQRLHGAPGDDGRQLTK